MSKATDAILNLSFLEELSAGDSPLHRLHPGVKITVTFCFLVVVLSLHRYNLSGLLGFFFYPAILIPLAGIPLGAIAKRTLIALPFSLFAAISNLIFERQVLATLGNLSITYGMVSFTTLMLKTLLCVSAVLILAATTGSFQLFGQLRRFHVPKILVLVLMMTYRYIFLLLLEVSHMTMAYHLRAPKEKGIRMKDMGSFVGQLLLRCFERAERVYMSMECRGFNGEYQLEKHKAMDFYSLCTGAVLIFGILFLRFFSLPQVFAGFFG